MKNSKALKFLKKDAYSQNRHWYVYTLIPTQILSFIWTMYENDERVNVPDTWANPSTKPISPEQFILWFM